MKRSSVLFTELDRRLSVSNNNQNKRKYKEENKKCRKNRQREKQRHFDKGTNKSSSLMCEEGAFQHRRKNAEQTKQWCAVQVLLEHADTIQNNEADDCEGGHRVQSSLRGICSRQSVV